MRMGTVIGRVTLSVRSPRYSGERLLLTLPWRRETFEGEEKFDPAIVVYDQLGANAGQEIGISEGREAACPFPKPTPVDAYCAVLIDEHFYKTEL
jgi:microcompartment protein CcmK/EutM